MAVLKHTGSSRRVVLEAECTVGRSSACSLVLDERWVSNHHAVVRWTGSRWEVRDLGSRNGTLLDGKRVASSEAHPLSRGSSIAFGRAEELWILDDDSPPKVMAIPFDGGDPLILDGDVTVVPSDDDPRGTIFLDPKGAWKFENLDGDVFELEAHTAFRIADRDFRLSCPAVVGATSTLAAPETSLLVKLRFAVSLDEEHVELVAEQAGRTIELGSRTHNYLLLTLARARLSDHGAGVPEPACGWVYQDELLEALKIPATQLNIDVFRIRRHVAKAGLQHFEVVERRPKTRQLRIGTGGLEVRTL